MPNSISPFFMFKLINKTQKCYKNKSFDYQRGQISLYKVRDILSSFYKNQNTLKCEYYLS